MRDPCSFPIMYQRKRRGPCQKDSLFHPSAAWPPLLQADTNVVASCEVKVTLAWKREVARDPCPIMCRLKRRRPYSCHSWYTLRLVGHHCYRRRYTTLPLNTSPKVAPVCGKRNTFFFVARFYRANLNKLSPPIETIHHRSPRNPCSNL